jgi:hypothetical protein
MNAGGRPAVDALEAANTLNANVARWKEQLGKVLGSDRSGEGVTAAIIRAASEKGGDARALLAARSAVPAPVWQDMAATAVGRLGLDRKGEFSPAIFLNDYAALSDRGKQLLFGSIGSGDLIGHLDDIARVSQKFVDAGKLANTSGTAGHSALYTGVAGAGFGLMHASVVEPITALSSIVGNNVLARALARPASAAAVARWARTYEHGRHSQHLAAAAVRQPRAAARWRKTVHIPVRHVHAADRVQGYRAHPRAPEPGGARRIRPRAADVLRRRHDQAAPDQPRRRHGGIRGRFHARARRLVGRRGGRSVDATTVFATGDLKHRYQDGVISGWVRANGNTIGSATSGATERANADCQSLFQYLWTNDTSLTVSTGRGASAAADWAANKTITLPDMRGRTLAGMDTMGSTNASRIHTILAATSWAGRRQSALQHRARPTCRPTRRPATSSSTPPATEPLASPGRQRWFSGTGSGLYTPAGISGLRDQWQRHERQCLHRRATHMDILRPAEMCRAAIPARTKRTGAVNRRHWTTVRPTSPSRPTTHPHTAQPVSRPSPAPPRRLRSSGSRSPRRSPAKISAPGRKCPSPSPRWSSPSYIKL